MKKTVAVKPLEQFKRKVTSLNSVNGFISDPDELRLGSYPKRLYVNTAEAKIQRPILDNESAQQMSPIPLTRGVSDAVVVSSGTLKSNL